MRYLFGREHHRMYVLKREKRTRYDIYADVLEAIKRNAPCTLTRASYGARMPVDRAKKVLARLEQAGFVRVELIGGRKHYVLAPLGAKFLELYGRLRALLALLEGGARR